MNVEYISDTTKKRVALELINQEISALTLTKRYYNEGKFEDEILECVERDMKQTHPEILNVILGKYIREMKDYLNTDGVSIDCQISDLIKDRGYLQNALRPIRTRENRFFTPKRVATKQYNPSQPNQSRLFDSNRVENNTRDINHFLEQTHVNPEDRDSMYIDEKLLGQKVYLKSTLSNGVGTYRHDDLYYAMLPHMDSYLRKSFKKTKRWGFGTLPNWVLESDDIMSVIDWKPYKAA